MTINAATTPTSSTSSQSVGFSASDNVAIASVQCRLNSGSYANCSSPYSTGTLTVGTNTIYVQATDTAGNVTTQTRTITVDQTGPTVTVTPGTTPTNSTASQNIAFTATDTNGVASVQCKVGAAGTYASCSSPFATGVLAVGTNTVFVQATDNAGNVTTQTTTVVVDQTAPTVTIGAVASPTSSTASQSVSFTATDDTAVASIQCRLNSGSYASCSSPFSTGTLSVGNNVVYVQATDSAGNVTTQTATIIVDQTAPTVTITPGTTPTNSTSSQSISFSASDANGVASIQCRTNSGSFAACASPYATGTLSVGTNTIDVRATDNAGNVTTQSTTIVVDQTAPSLTVNAPNSPTNSTSSQNITFSSSDASGIAMTRCKVGSGSFATCSSPFATGVLGVGSTVVTVEATDGAGNVTTESVTIVVDQTAPSVSITPPASPTNSTSSQSVAFTANDAGGLQVVECRIDSGSFSPCTSPFATGTLTPGSHAVSVRATDTAGNVTIETATIVVDQTNPAVSITPPTSPTNSTASQDVTFSASDANGLATVECRIDGGSYAACTSPYATGTLTEGTHTVDVRATDNAGNVTTQSATIVVDTTNPTVSITPPTSPTNSTASQDIGFTAGDDRALASVQCRLDSGSFAACTAPFATGTLAPGTHTVYVRATDTAGNVTTESVAIVVDTGAPVVSIDAPDSPTSSTASQDITFTASDNDGLQTVRCKVDSGSYAPCASPFATGTLTEGTHIVYVEATDNASNVNTQTISIVVDTTAPSLSIDPPTSPTGSEASQDISFTASDAVGIATIECRVGADSYVPCTSPFATGTLPEGTNTVSVRVTDDAGNVTEDSVTIVVDQTAPSVSIDPPTSPTNSSTSQDVSFTATDSVGVTSIECKLDAASYAPCTSPFATGTLAPGTHTVYVQVTDSSGNVTTETTTIVVDQTDPTISIDAADSPTNSTASQDITFTAGDDAAVAGIRCKVGAAGTYAACTSPFATGTLSVGDNEVFVEVTDVAGNVTEDSVTITVDQTAPAAPTATLTAPSSSPASTDEATITYSGIEAGAAAECSTDGATWAPCDASPITLAGLADGTQDYYVRQVDAAGNPSTATHLVWVVDTTAPDAPTVSGPPTQTNNPNASFSFTGEPGATFACQFNGGSWTTCTSPVEIPLSTDGPYTFSVKQTDEAGNEGPAETVNFTLDTAGPGAPSIDTAPPSLSPSSDADFTFSPAEPGGSLRCQLDGQPAAPCAPSLNLIGLSDGPHTLTIWQVDGAGNPGDTTTYSWTVDTAAPPAPSVDGPTGTVGFTDATIIFSDSESGVTFECDIDGGGFAPCTSPLELTGLADGAHEVKVIAKDATGNASPEATVSWTVDHNLYTVEIAGAPTGLTQSQDANLTLTASLSGSTLECDVDGAGFAPCSSPLELTGLSDGVHTVDVRAKKGAQTSDVASASWEVDHTGPTVVVTAPGTGSTTGSSANIAFTATDVNAPVSISCELNSGAPFACTSGDTITSLPAGTNTLVVTGTDAAGNAASGSTTWTVDLTPPAIPEITTPAGDVSTSDLTPKLSGTAEPNTTVHIYESGSLVATVTSDGSGDWTWTPSSDLSEGEYVYTVTSEDAFGNESDPSDARKITVDTTAPAAPSITQPSAGPLNSAMPVVGGTAEPGSNVTVYVDGSPAGTATANGSGGWSWTVTSALAEGDHTFAATATDPAGNVGPASSDVDVTVDTTLPAVAITSPTAGAQLKDSDIDVTFTAEAGATLECKLDSDAWIGCTSPFTLTNPAEGTHTVSVRATDAAGNAAMSVVTFSIDRTAPNAPTISGPAALTTDNTPTFTGTAEPGSSVLLTIGGDTYGPVTADGSGNWSITVSPALADGDHTATATATDAAGNESPASGDVDFNVDTTAPAAPTIDDPNNSVDDPFVVTDATPTVSGNAGSAEAGATVRVYVNGNSVGTATAAGDGSWSLTLTSTLSDGTYTLTARATDAIGNQSPLTTAVNVRVDANNPTATLTGTPNSRSNVTTPAFSFTADEPATFECRVDGGSWTVCTSPTTLAALLDGEHTFEVRAKDASGNYSTPKSYTWTVDTQAPTLTITTSTVAPGVTPTFELVSSESGTTYTCKIDSAPATSCSTPFSPGTLPVGTHTLVVTATDQAGNTVHKSVTFTVEAPVTPTTPTSPSTPTTPATPEAPTCPGADSEEVGKPAAMTLLSAKLSSGGSLIRFTTQTDQFVLIRLTLKQGSRTLGTVVRDNKPGKRNLALKIKKKLPKNATLKVHMSAVTMSGGKSVADATLTTDKKGKQVVVSGADGKVGETATSTISCGKESGGKKIKVKVASVAQVKVNVKNMVATAVASDWAVATFRVDQGGKKVGRKVVVLKPKKKVKVKLALGTSIGSVKLAKGTAKVTVSTFTADGVRQLFKKNLKVK